MKKVIKQIDLAEIQNRHVRQQMEILLDHLLNEYKTYCIDGSISSIGAVYFVESNHELEDYRTFGLVEPITESRFEFIEEIGNGVSHGVLVITDDYAISIFSSTEILNKHFERIKDNEHN